jgi:hypothetical protein
MKKAIVLLGAGLVAVGVLWALLSGPGAPPAPTPTRQAASQGGPAPSSPRPATTRSRVPDGTPAARPGEDRPASDKPGKPASKDGKGDAERWWVPIPSEKFVELFQAKAASRDAFVKQHDTDGDGVLSEAERAAVFAEKIELSERDRLRYFDADKDGVLSEIEREEGEAIMAAKNAESASWAEAANRRLERRLARFDADGDGALNLDESYAAYLSDVQAKAAWRFRDRYDADADGSVGPPDLEAFLTLYAEKDEGADANDDGSVNERDIEAFELMMSAQPAPPDKP